MRPAVADAQDSLLMMLWFITPVSLAGRQELLLILPLCLAVAVVRRLTRIDSVREALPVILITWAVYSTAMVVLGIGLYALAIVMT